MQFNNNSVGCAEVFNKPAYTKKRTCSMDKSFEGKSFEGIEKKLIVVSLMRTPEKKAD